MTTRRILTIIYILFAFNALCEAACLPDCDTDKVNTFLQIEDCEHVTCELSHKNQHKYIKDDFSKNLKQVNALLSINELNIDFSRLFYINIDEELNQDSMTHQFSNVKRIIVYKKLKIFIA